MGFKLSFFFSALKSDGHIDAGLNIVQTKSPISDGFP